MMPIAVTYSAPSVTDRKAASEGEPGWARADYTASKLQLAMAVTAAMRGAAFAKRRGVIRPARAQRLFSEFDGALRFRAERCGSSEPETAALAVLIAILSATGPRYNLV
jgi:hypothetical protein